jgi:protein SCO1
MSLSSFPKRTALASAAVLAAFAWSGGVCAENEPSDPHAQHHHPVPSKAAWVKMRADYTLPEITLVRADGTKVSLPKELDDGKPVILDFIYTTCTAICPVMSQTFAGVQKRLGEEREKVHMVSISIDPEQDTPQRLREYAKRYGAGPQWQFYTGTLEASIATQKAFDNYRGDKMNHVPVTFIRGAPGDSWERIEGFATPDDIVNEYRMLMAAR